MSMPSMPIISSTIACLTLLSMSLSHLLSHKSSSRISSLMYLLIVCSFHPTATVRAEVADEHRPAFTNRTFMPLDNGVKFPCVRRNGFPLPLRSVYVNTRNGIKPLLYLIAVKKLCCHRLCFIKVYVSAHSLPLDT